MLLIPQTQVEIQANLQAWFQTKLKNAKARPDTIAYVAGILTDHKLANLVVCGSVVLAFSNAVQFDEKRKLADGVLAAEIAFSGWHAQPELCIELARRSYASCWNILKPHWPLYEELADRLPEIVVNMRSIIQPSR
jgi:hypothetical protein